MSNNLAAASRTISLEDPSPPPSRGLIGGDLLLQPVHHQPAWPAWQMVVTGLGWRKEHEQAAAGAAGASVTDQSDQQTDEDHMATPPSRARGSPSPGPAAGGWCPASLLWLGVPARPGPPGHQPGLACAAAMAKNLLDVDNLLAGQAEQRQGVDVMDNLHPRPAACSASTYAWSRKNRTWLMFVDAAARHGGDEQSRKADELPGRREVRPVGDEGVHPGRRPAADGSRGVRLRPRRPPDRAGRAERGERSDRAEQVELIDAKAGALEDGAVVQRHAAEAARREVTPATRVGNAPAPRQG